MNSQDSKTLQELEGIDWGEPAYQSSVVVNCHRLRRVPLKDFRIEDLRLMIGQKISLNWLIPVALQRLATDPLAAGDMGPGDLLRMVLAVPRDFWEQRDDLRQQLIDVLKSVALPTDGDFYPSDLVYLVMTVPRDSWEQHDDLRQQLIDMLKSALVRIEQDEPLEPTGVELKNEAIAELAELLSPRSGRESLK